MSWTSEFHTYYTYLLCALEFAYEILYLSFLEEKNYLHIKNVVLPNEKVLEKALISAVICIKIL